MYERILIAVDGSATSNKALSSAIEMANYAGGKAVLKLLHVLDQTAYLVGSDPYNGYYGAAINAMREAGEKILAEALAIAQSAGIQAESLLIDQLGAHLAETVALEAVNWGASLVVVGTHGRRGIGRLLMGSGAEQVIRLAPCPVLVVRLQGTENAAKL